jgi:hypothetical protein
MMRVRFQVFSEPTAENRFGRTLVQGHGLSASGW